MGNGYDDPRRSRCVPSSWPATKTRTATARLNAFGSVTLFRPFRRTPGLAQTDALDLGGRIRGGLCRLSILAFELMMVDGDRYPYHHNHQHRCYYRANNDVAHAHQWYLRVIPLAAKLV